MTALSIPAAPPALRCEHIETLDLPVFGLVEARCWRAAESITGMCVLHATQARAARAAARVDAILDLIPEPPAQPFADVEYLCPAPTSRLFRCRRPLPCTSHGVRTAATGMVLHGSTLMRPTGESGVARIKRLAKTIAAAV